MPRNLDYFLIKNQILNEYFKNASNPNKLIDIPLFAYLGIFTLPWYNLVIR